MAKPPQNTDDFRELIRMLGEEERARTIDCIWLLVDELGLEAIREYVDHALQIQDEGGALTGDESRRRTTGGIFFALLKKALGAAELDRITLSGALDPALTSRRSKRKARYVEQIVRHKAVKARAKANAANAAARPHALMSAPPNTPRK